MIKKMIKEHTHFAHDNIICTVKKIKQEYPNHCDVARHGHDGVISHEVDNAFRSSSTLADSAIFLLPLI